MSEYRQNNLEKCREIERRYRQTPKGRAAKKRKQKGWMQRYRTDSKFRLYHCLRQRIKDALRKSPKASRTFDLIGCSIEHLRAWITFYFQPGMTWANYGTVWHIDHDRPCASFDLTDPAQQKECFHYTNLQPLFVEENLRKGAKWV